MVREVIGVADRARSPPDAVNVVMAHLTVRRRHLRRRRAGRPVDLRVQRARPASSRSRRALRGARPPAPAADAARALPGALQRRRRSRWTSASRTTPASSAWSRPTPATPARITDIPITAGRRLRTVHGTARRARGAAPTNSATTTCGCTLREPTRAGLRDDDRRRPAQRPGGAHRPGVRRRRRTRGTARPRPAPTGRPGSCSPTTAPPGQVSRPAGRGAVRRAARRGHRRRRRRADAAADEGRNTMRPVLLDMDGFASFRDAGARRLHRRRLLRPGRPDRLGQVDGHRRDDVRPVRVGAPLGPQGHGLARARPHRRPRHRQAGLRGRRASATSWPGSCAAPAATVSQRAASLERLADPRGLARPGDADRRAWPRTWTASPRPSRGCSA